MEYEKKARAVGCEVLNTILSTIEHTTIAEQSLQWGRFLNKEYHTLNLTRDLLDKDLDELIAKITEELIAR